MIQLIIKTDDVSLLKTVIDHVEKYTQQSLDALEASIEWSATKGDTKVAHQKIEFNKGTTEERIKESSDRHEAIFDYLKSKGPTLIDTLKSDLDIDGRTLRHMFVQNVLRKINYGNGVMVEIVQ